VDKLMLSATDMPVTNRHVVSDSLSDWLSEDDNSPIRFELRMSPRKSGKNSVRIVDEGVFSFPLGNSLSASDGLSILTASGY
jgi:hypothetical protein